MCEHLGRCSVPGAYNTSAGSAEPLTSRPNERIKGGQGELDLNLSRRNGKRQSGRNQATGRKLQVGQLDSRTGLGRLTDLVVDIPSVGVSPFPLLLDFSGFSWGPPSGCSLGFISSQKFRWAAAGIDRGRGRAELRWSRAEPGRVRPNCNSLCA